MDIVKINSMLKEHELWLKSGGSNGRRAILDGENLQQSNLSNVDLSYAILKNVNFTRANLVETKLCNAYLVGSILSYADCRNADLSYANFNNSTLESVNLTEANLQGALFQNAILVNSDLTGTNISNTDMAQTDLTNAIFTSAVIVDTNFENSLLNDIIFSGEQVELKKALYEISHAKRNSNISFIKLLVKKNSLLFKIINVFGYLVVSVSIIAMVIVSLSKVFSLLGEDYNINLHYFDLMIMLFIGVVFILITQGLKILAFDFSIGKRLKK